MEEILKYPNFLILAGVRGGLQSLENYEPLYGEILMYLFF